MEDLKTLDYTLQEKLIESHKFIVSQSEQPPSVGIILGSGLGSFASGLENYTSIPFKDIPHFPGQHGHVEGHAGNLVLSQLSNGLPIACLQGRFHYYQGHSLDEVVYPVRVLRQLGVKTLIVTNAAGGINPEFKPGDLMLITDHLNLMGTNPLLGPNHDFLGPRFPDMSQAYCPTLQEKAHQAAQKIGCQLVTGVYAGLTGPSYETPAEIKMLRTLGADAVGMSTVPEVIVANHMGMKVLGISCISNLAAGISENPLNHDEVLETGERIRPIFIKLLTTCLELLGDSEK